MQIDHDNRDDARLVELVLAGEREAFSPLLMRYYPSLLRLCRRLLGPTLEAQDIAQEAALQAFLGLKALHEPARFGAWLHAIAANLARMALRRRRLLSLDNLDNRAALVTLWPDGRHTPEEVHAARECHDAIVAALNELSVVNREVVIGFYLEGYSYAELAELLGVPLSTVKGRLFKGRRQLQRALEPLAQEVLKPDRRPRKEHVMTSPDLVEVRIESIRMSLETEHSRMVVLSEQGGERLLPIWIGPFEADAIALALQGQQPQRPMTHDLALRLLEPLGAQVRQVVVNRLAENTFYAEIMLALGDQTHTIDARPSDAIALAVRTNAPIYVARAVLDQASVPPEAARVKEGDLIRTIPDLGLTAPDPFFVQIWSFILRSAVGTSGPPDIQRLREVNWSERFPTRELEWEGQPIVAVQLPDSGDAPAWLLVSPDLWSRLDQRMQRATTDTIDAPGWPRFGAQPGASPEPAEAGAEPPA